MAFKKRVNSISNTELNVTTEYGRKGKGLNKTYSLVMSGLLMTSMVTSMGTTVFANDTTNGVVIEEVVDTNATDEEEFNKAMLSRAEARGVKESKLAGEDRYKTAINVSKAGWSTSTKAILINGTALPDALTATPLAEEYNAPILLTEKDKLNNDTLTELKRLGVKEITLIGSEGVISNAQEQNLISLGFKVERLGGIDRVDTSVKVAYKLKEIYAAKNNTGQKIVFVANGIKGLADATSVASPAGFKDAVILYTNGSNLNGIKRYIETSADVVYLVGGTNAISSGVETELKNTTNKKIVRLAGDTRKDTNAKVISEFFPNANINKVYVAKDGSGNESQLVDALAVGSLAGKEKNPVLISSGDLSASQRTLIDSKEVKEVVQVGEGANATATRQVVGIINAVAEPEPSDGMRLPTINWAKENNIKYPYKWGGAYGGGSNCSVGENEIKGDLYVKFGDLKYGPHTYGAGNQEEYNKIVTFVKDALKSINFRYQPEWVYMMHYMNGGKADSFVDPILSQKGINTTYGQWKNNNKDILNGIANGTLSKADAEKLAMFNSAVAHVLSKIPSATTNRWAWSAHQFIFEKTTSTLATAEVKLLVGDLLGLNVMVAGTDWDDTDVAVQLGNYWWTKGKTILYRSNTKTPLYKTDRPYIHMNACYEAPTYNLDAFYK